MPKSHFRNAEIDAVIDEARRWGAAFVRVDRGSKHARVVFERNGLKYVVSTSLTPSDAVRGPLNARASLRRVLGVAWRLPVKGTKPPRALPRLKPRLPRPQASVEGDDRIGLAEGLRLFDRNATASKPAGSIQS